MALIVPGPLWIKLLSHFHVRLTFNVKSTCNDDVQETISMRFKPINHG